MTIPRCPVTGEPAVRLIQTVSSELLLELWRRTLGVDARASFGGTARFGLWESPTGLYFFDPPLEGDATFYESFYAFGPMRRYLHQWDRAEFRMAASHVRPGDRVLDVGCGFGPFRRHVPNAIYLGLDPHFAGGGDHDVRRETLRDHLIENAGRYDVVTAFQVIEHLAAPGNFVADLTRAVRPGGKVVIGVPQVGGAHTRIPNYLVNAPPHHLTWWTEAALVAVASTAGLEVEEISTAPWSRVDSVVYWMSRLSLVKCDRVFYRHSWSWHVSAVVGGVMALLANRMLPVPDVRTDPGISLLLIAERSA